MTRVPWVAVGLGGLFGLGWASAVELVMKGSGVRVPASASKGPQNRQLGYQLLCLSMWGSGDVLSPANGVAGVV